MSNIDRPLSRPVLALAAIYAVASLAHFVHNAEYIAFYPGMPAWLSAEKVYVAWVGVTLVGVMSLVFGKLRFGASALIALGIYGALGLDGLGHYTLALCSEHTLVSNLTIWAEAVSGLMLLLTASVLLGRRLQPAARRSHA
jgi:hypothetical protein